jgi:hypothetical protein
MIIWANHNLRASVNAMQKTSKSIFEDKSLINIEDKVRNFIRQKIILRKTFFYFRLYQLKKFSDYKMIKSLVKLRRFIYQKNKLMRKFVQFIK